MLGRFQVPLSKHGILLTVSAVDEILVWFSHVVSGNVPLLPHSFHRGIRAVHIPLVWCICLAINYMIFALVIIINWNNWKGDLLTFDLAVRELLFRRILSCIPDFQPHRCTCNVHCRLLFLLWNWWYICIDDDFLMIFSLLSVETREIANFAFPLHPVLMFCRCLLGDDDYFYTHTGTRCDSVREVIHTVSSQISQETGIDTETKNGENKRIFLRFDFKISTTFTCKWES